MPRRHRAPTIIKDEPCQWEGQFGLRAIDLQSPFRSYKVLNLIEEFLGHDGLVFTRIINVLVQ